VAREAFVALDPAAVGSDEPSSRVPGTASPGRPACRLGGIRPLAISPHLPCVESAHSLGQRRRLANGTMVMSLKSCPKARSRVGDSTAIPVRWSAVRSGASSNPRRHS
jgi:hypothetical protein